MWVWMSAPCCWLLMQPHGDQGSSPLSSDLCPLGPTMISAESILESGDQPYIPLQPLNNKHLPGKVTPTAVFMDTSSPVVTANGVHDIEDRILRITGYYGYNPGYSSHRSEWVTEWVRRLKNKVVMGYVLYKLTLSLAFVRCEWNKCSFSLCKY